MVSEGALATLGQKITVYRRVDPNYTKSTALMQPSNSGLLVTCEIMEHDDIKNTSTINRFFFLTQILTELCNFFQ